MYILSRQGQILHKFSIKGWSNIDEFNWTVNGKELYVVSRVRGESVLLHVDLQGNAKLLWKNPVSTGETLATPSPDGRHLAIQTWTTSGNMWSMEDY
jgi:hypothetical protein